MSLLNLVLGASPVVQGVMLVLLLASVASWAFILQKSVIVRRARIAADAFEDRFWSGADLATVYRELASPRHMSQGMETMFVGGFKGFARQRKQPGAGPREVVEGAQRAMRAALGRELDRLETHLPFLATVGSTSPYVGLFGTVWGIMNAFRALGDVEQATLALVAPGIAEALVATAMGLVAAIPAVVAYNRFASDVERLGNRYDSFAEEFSTVLQRYAHD